ncbi:6925f8e7-00ad-4ba9-9215-5fd0af771822 [Thermothielavioides terrestris]|uniref:6925f8e7-00ad-4ba9-9215-5fd0af771822 n=1 Tax=Thermothielavioides terrestris TaxID=2587410 RepID=A0A3S4AZH9_9PEZI|nr:6925f8e7-00ad-4ba9-9215-5fd0af771822 [Thermothielavioides terrestris]
MSLPSSPAGGTGQPLQPVSLNAQRESSLLSAAQHHRERLNLGDSAPLRDSSVHEKINQYNSLAMQSKTLERKSADAALKRAMLGREEAEAEMRRYRDEARALRKQIEEGKERERKVGERLEAVMENYGRAKETHAHTQQLWEKEIRRARKETFKAQSALVKLQEELKSCRTAQKAFEEELQAERERSKQHEQEAFNAQYSLVGLQEQLNQAQERIKMLEQELEALKTMAKNEAEVRRLASEGAGSERYGDDSEVPRKRQRLSSAADTFIADPEIETLMMLWQWEKQRADRALEQVQFLEAECRLKACTAAKSLRRSSSRRLSSPRRKRASLPQVSDAGDPMILSESSRVSAEATKPTPPRRSKTDLLRVEKEPRRSTIFLPAEGIFRTVSQAEADALAAKSAAASAISPTDSAPSLPITPTDSDPMYRRTPSVDPPDFAMLSKERTSLLSLLNAPHRQDPAPIFNIPTTPGPEPGTLQPEPEEEDTEAPPTIKPSHQPPRELSIPSPEPADSSLTAPFTDPLPSTGTTATTTAPAAIPRPHTTASYYPTSKTTTTTIQTTTVTTTTKVPLREEPRDGPTLAQRLLRLQRTPSRQTGGAGADDGIDRPSFDVTNPALTPTMTREEALAQIRERRGRARSVGRVAPGAGSSSSSSAAAHGGSGSGSGRSSGSGGVNASGRSSGSGGIAEGRRKVSGGSDGTVAASASASASASATGVRRKVSSSELGGGGAGRRREEGAATAPTAASRGRERDRREVSAPTSGAATAGAGTVRGMGARRVRS